MDSSTLSRSTKNRKRKRSNGLTYLGPKEEHFEQYILLPSGIRIRRGIRHSRPEELPNDSIQDDPSKASRVHLEIDYTTASEISTQLIFYHQRIYDEATLTKLVTQYMAPFQLYVDPDGP